MAYVSQTSRWRRNAQPRNYRHYYQAEAGLTDHIATELSQQVRASWNSGELSFDGESIPRAQADENAECRKLGKQEPAVARREERANRTDQQPRVGNAANDKDAYATEAERGEAAKYEKVLFAQ
jgi:hypothetical protein